MATSKTPRRPAKLTELDRKIKEAAPGWPYVADLTLEQARVLGPLIAERKRLEA